MIIKSNPYNRKLITLHSLRSSVCILQIQQYSKLKFWSIKILGTIILYHEPVLCNLSKHQFEIHIIRIVTKIYYWTTLFGTSQYRVVERLNKWIDTQFLALLGCSNGRMMIRGDSERMTKEAVLVWTDRQASCRCSNPRPPTYGTKKSQYFDRYETEILTAMNRECYGLLGRDAV
jgi:hypothetical protein